MKKLLTLFTALLFVGSMWGTAYISYNGTTEDASTTISAKNVSSGSAGKISWTGTSCTYSDGRVNIAANGSITFTATSGFAITKIVITSGSSASYYGTWTSSPSVTPSKSGGVTTFDGLSANTVTVTTSTAFRCTSASHIKIYYAQVVNSLSIKTPPTKLNYKVGEELDLTGLKLDADGTEVTTGYTASPANGATLNTVGIQEITFTYGGKTVKDTVHVGGLKSIAITNPPTKKEYNQGQTFDPTGMVVEATFSDSATMATEWDVEVDDYTYPTTGLEAGATSVTISYTWAGTTKTDNQAITVNAATAYTVTFDAGTGSCETASLTESEGLAGVELPTATIGITGWSFAGWATASTANTETAPTLYTAGSTYHPTENCTLYAVYKFIDTSSTIYKRATDVSDITSASSVVIVCNNQSKVLDNTLAGGVSAPTEKSSKITAPENAIFTLTGNNTDGYTLTNGTTTIGATSTDNSTVISNTTTNKLWVVKTHNTSNTFYFENKGKDNLCLEYYNNSGYKWMVYAPATPSSNAAMAMKVYVPNSTTVYNSNPATMINPTVAFTTAGDKNLYVQDEASYTNVANVTGIAKSPVYSSSDETVATVSEAGVVTALKAGSATITAKVEEEIGVNTEAKATYNVTVKDAKTIAGLKAITDASSVKSFTADLTDAVVTYVDGNYAYIQDASGAVYASCGSSLTAGNKINGAVSGSIKAAYKIDEITAINLDDATVTEDGVIPAALTKTVAQILASEATLDGQLIQVSAATVTANFTSTTSGCKISDDNKVSELNIYAPKSNIEALKDAEGTFQGFISINNGNTYRLNIYNQSQITITRNAPTDQTLSFESEAFVLDKPSAEYTAFAGQTVNGAETTPVYSIEDGDDENGVVTSINSETGVVVLSGNEGTATITVTAPAGETVTAGVTTPWNEATLTYTVQVRNIYDVNLVIKVDGVEEAHGNQATIAGGTATVKKHANETVALTATRTTGYQFVKWTTSSTNIEIAAEDSTKTSDLSATVQGAGTIYANFTAVPELLVSETALDLGYAKLDSTLDAKTFTISGESLEEGNLTLTLDNSIKDAFIVSPNQIAVNGKLNTTIITVTPVTSVAGEFSGNLTISGGGLAAVKTVALTSEIEQTYKITWIVNGEETSLTDIAGTALVAPSAGTISGKTVIGWTDAAIATKTDTKPTIVSLSTMPAKDTTLYALYATESSASQVKEFSYMITTSDFNTSGYDANDGDKEVTAVCTSDNTLTVDIEWTSYQMCINGTKVQGKKNVGKVYNQSAWGKGITSVTINGNDGFSKGIGSEANPTSEGTGAFFQVIAGSSASTATSITITFDSTVTVTTYNAYVTRGYAVTIADGIEHGTVTIKNGTASVASGDLVAYGTTLTVEAEPESDQYILSSLLANTTDIKDSESYTMGNEAVTIIAEFIDKSTVGFDNTEVGGKAVKVLRNGVLYIEKNGRIFNAQGQLVK